MQTDAFPEIDIKEVWSNPRETLEFVLPGLAIATVGNVVAPGGAGKTFLMLATAMSVAVGGDVGNIWGAAQRPGNCVYLSLEDPEVELRIRLHALAARLSEEEKRIAPDRLRILPAAGRGFTLASHAFGRSPKRSEAFLKFEDFLVKKEPRLLVIDTLNRALGGLAENDAGAMGWMLGQLEALARDLNCAVVLCHHVSKGAAAAGAVDAHAARGSSAITDNARWQANLSAPVGRSTARTHVRLEITKANYQAAAPARWLRRDKDGILVFDKSATAHRSKLRLVKTDRSLPVKRLA